MYVKVTAYQVYLFVMLFINKKERYVLTLYFYSYKLFIVDKNLQLTW